MPKDYCDRRDPSKRQMHAERPPVSNRLRPPGFSVNDRHRCESDVYISHKAEQVHVTVSSPQVKQRLVDPLFYASACQLTFFPVSCPPYSVAPVYQQALLS